jgi:Luciferase-like monooxygenase
LTALYQSTQGSPASWRQIEYYAQQIGSDPMDATFELGLYTFGDLMPEAKAGKAVGARQRLADILAAAKLADVSGLDIFAVGEHHRLDMAVSATPVVLATIATVTERIRVASAVTILSTADQRGVQWLRGCQ